MHIPRFAKLASKRLLTSDNWPCIVFRWLSSRILFGLGAIAKPINPTTADFLKIYACVLTFDPDGLAAEINSINRTLDNQLIIASRAFFEIAFSRGELPKICNFLQKTTTSFPYLFIPWKLLHYYCYFTKSRELLSEVHATYEVFRATQLDSVKALDYDVIFGDHVTASIGHSQIFFDFEILYSRLLTTRPKIAVCRSSRDRMSSFYRELMPDVLGATISLEPNLEQRDDLVHFVQDSFPFMITKKYFGYQEERGRAKYLATWAATGTQAFVLTVTQSTELEIFLKSLGLGDKDWYVVIHVREGTDNSIRNADIDTYYGAIDAVILNGGWIFRIGDATMTPLRKGIPRVVDLPFMSTSRPRHIDLYLLATARFVICTASGPSDFPFYFNVPRLVTNWPVMYALFGVEGDICIPVSYHCNSRNAIVTLREQLTSTVYDDQSKLQALKEIRLIKNSMKQIEQGTHEMIGLTAKSDSRTHFHIPAPNSLIYKFRDNFWFMGSISNAFLEDYPNYLD